MTEPTTDTTATPQTPDTLEKKAHWATIVNLRVAVVTLVVTVVFGIASVVFGYLEVFQGQQPAQPAATPTHTSAAQPGASRNSTDAAPPTGNVTYLDTLRPERGGAHLVPLPRALQGRPEYVHAVVVGCPTNATDDRVREVTYSLRGRYVDFTATVRTYSEPADDGPVEVTAVVGIPQRDGTLTQAEEGQARATMAITGTLRASVEGGDELTLRVRCEWPDAVVILADARLVRA